MTYRPVIPETQKDRLMQWYSGKVRNSDIFKGVTFADVLDELLKEVGF